MNTNPQLPIYAYFPEWGAANGFFAKNLDESGAAAQITHILYGFGNVVDGEAVMHDPFETYQRPYTESEAVDGKADGDGDDLKGHLGQLRKLKARYPHVKVLYSFGGWVLSPGFSDAASDPEKFAESAYRLLHDSRWADVFDGIDIDWEYPNATGIAADTSGPHAYPDLIKTLRRRFGGELVTSAIGADASSGGILDVGGYDEAAPYIDAYLLMTYDYMNGNDTAVAPHSALYDFDGNPKSPACTETSVDKLIALGVPPEKIYLGVGLYGRGWKGVPTGTPGSVATGPADSDGEPGAATYRWLREAAPATNIVGGTAYAYDGDAWWGYDTPETVKAKMAYAREKGLGGAFYWESSGDTDNADMARAMRSGIDGAPE
ncbi:glycoside hydrolase family 18 protein [Haloglycomyces albus]|uniref:glycoside hydrolase family 18 protein n=1 Tax=Haloglycomyces albus TaxID=526067 RepID=UPI00046CF8E2|nr:glycosyl hydrolase family 18 protein [Haloglycomyces albus]